MLNPGLPPPGAGHSRLEPAVSAWLVVAVVVGVLAAGCAGGRGGNGGSTAPGAAPAGASGASAGSADRGPAAPDSLPQLSPAELAALTKGPPELRGSAYLFTYVSRRARSVAVAGTFNGWVPTANPLARRALAPAAGGDAAPDSLWYALVPVARGGHRYKFLVDGNRWLVDPANPKQAGDGSGGVASVLTVR